MLLKIDNKNFVIYYREPHTHNEIYKQEDIGYINLSLIPKINIKSCDINRTIDGIGYHFTYEVSFIVHGTIDDGCYEYITLFFENKNDSEFIRVKNILENLTYLSSSSNDNHKANQKNANLGTNGVNKTYSQVHGNRGKQLNTKETL